MNFKTSDELVLGTERANLSLQKIFRARLYRLSFKLIPKVMIWYLYMIWTIHLNYFPQKRIMMSYFLPHIIISGQAVDCGKHLAYSFGAYVRASTIKK